MMRYVVILSMMLWTASALAAQQNQSLYGVQQNLQRAYAPLAEASQSAWKGSPIDRNLFPPELVMRHRAEIELTDVQRSELIGVIQEFQSAIVGVEWELQDAKLELEQKLAMHPTSVEAVEQALDNVFTYETQIKKRHILMLVTVKNVLNPTQIDYLMERRNPYVGQYWQRYKDWTNRN